MVKIHKNVNMVIAGTEILNVSVQVRNMTCYCFTRFTIIVITVKLYYFSYVLPKLLESNLK